MNIHEHQAKEILKRFDIPTLNGVVIYNPAEVSEKIGADWFDIMPALRMDKRIGQYSYITPGLGISGGNLERDLNTILDIGDKTKINCDIINSWKHNSFLRKNYFRSQYIKL